MSDIKLIVGVVSTPAIDRTKDIERVGFRELVAATLARLLTACIAGTFFSERSVLLG